MLVARGLQKQLGGIGGPAGDDDDVARENRSSLPSRSTTTSVTAVPSTFVSSLMTLAFVSSVTFGCSSAGRTPNTSASDLAWTRHGNPSHVGQRMHVLFGMSASFRRMPHGAWNGR